MVGDTNRVFPHPNPAFPCFMKIAISLASLFLSILTVSAETYYIDYAGGNDTADGRSPRSAWKHAPGDNNATGTPATIGLAPGDTLIFKGGVTYRGSIRLTVSGAEGKPITLDGNTKGKFGKGAAILDGGQVIENWKRVENPEQVKGNPRWKDIFFADIDLDISSNFNHGEVVVHREAPRNKRAPWQRVILYDGERRLLPISQFPKPEDPFYPDLPSDFRTTPDRMDVRAAEGITVITDEEYLTQEDENYFEGMFLGVHGGNNHTFFTRILRYDPNKHQLVFPEFKHSTYPTTQYALYNSVRLISEPGEWAIEPLEGGKTRIYLLADRLVKGEPDNIGFPVFESGVSIENGASHLAVRGFLIQRYAGVGGGVSIKRSPEQRSRDITVSGCEIRFVSGHAGVGVGFADEVTVENCYIHQCPGWTTAIFLDRVNDYVVRNNRLDKNSGSGIRHYESKRGLIEDNVILNHYGMHSSTINVYEGCEDVLIQNNYMHNVVTINRNAENITLRNNVIDSQGRNASNIALWTSGRTGGTEIHNVLIENNTLVNTNEQRDWSTSVFILTNDTTKLPEGLVIRNNILSRLREPIPAKIENNIFTRPTDEAVMGEDGKIITDLDKLFRDPGNGDYRRKRGGPMMKVGADVLSPEKHQAPRGPNGRKS